MMLVLVLPLSKKVTKYMLSSLVIPRFVMTLYFYIPNNVITIRVMERMQNMFLFHNNM